MNIEKLYPECKDNIWGGTKLTEKYGKITDKSPCAESWELSFHKDGETRISDGRKLSEVVTPADLGTNVEGFPFFPTLIKFIDAEDNLSVQVHPSDSYALEHENSFGKTEMWYIVEAEKGAGIYLGFNRDITHEEYRRAIEEKRLADLLNFYEVKSGECYFIPSGTVHAIGKGCLICEIQQNSNLTYRVYDYGRRDKDGNERELHIEKALLVSNLKKQNTSSLSGTLLGISKYFTVNKIVLNGEMQIRTDGSTFKCITSVRGSAEIDGQHIATTDSYFVPANYGEFTLRGDCDLIITEIRKYRVSVTDAVTLEDDEGRIIASAEITGGVDSAISELLASVNMSSSDLS